MLNGKEVKMMIGEKESTNILVEKEINRQASIKKKKKGKKKNKELGY